MQAIEKVTAFITRTNKQLDQKELLLFQHPYAGIQIPAGTVELGEAPQVAVVREAEEETGLSSFEKVHFIGEQLNTLEDNYLMVNQQAKIYARADATSISWAEIRRGIMVKALGRENSQFSHIQYVEHDTEMDKQFETYNITGWTEKDNLTTHIKRYFYHLEANDDRNESWIQYSDEHHFKLFWAPLAKLPDIHPAQKAWLDYIMYDCKYSLV